MHVQFNGSNLAECVAFIGDSSVVKSDILTSEGKRYFIADLAGWGDEEYFYRVVEGEWLVRRNAIAPVVRYYESDYDGQPSVEEVQASQIAELTDAVNQLILDALMGGI